MFPSFCLCGAQAGWQHAATCPYPLYFDHPETRALWEDARAAIKANRAAITADLDRQADSAPNADPKCPYCHGTGEVLDWVDYGSTTVSMPSPCECIGGTEEEE